VENKTEVPNNILEALKLKFSNKIQNEDSNNMKEATNSKKLVLKGLDENTVIHCQTQEEANKVTALANKASLTWVNGKPYEANGNKWDVRGVKTCYLLSEGVIHSIDYFKNENYKIISAEEFIKLNSKPKVPNVPLTPEQLEFNLDRLAAESDIVFKKQLVEAKSELKKESDSVALDVLGTLKEKVMAHRDAVAGDFQKEVEKVLVDTKEMLLEELRKGRTTINVNTGEAAHSYSISTDDHYMMEEVFESLLLHKKVMLVGEAGAGKTYMITEMAKKMEIPFYKYSCSRDSSVHDLIGYKQPRSETYLMTTFLDAYENGGVFLCDEYDACPSDVALFFNGVADSSKSISIPHRDGNPIAYKHPQFYIVMCGNTWGKGSQDYNARDFQDMALLDRFRMCRHFIGYDAALEKSMIGETMYPFATDLREILTKLGSYLSTRNVEDIAMLLNSGKNIDFVLKTMASDLEETDKKTFKQANLETKHKSTYEKFNFDLKLRLERAEKEAKKQKV